MSVGRITIRDVARLAEVHYATVSTVLNGAKGSTRVSEETSRRVLNAADTLGYRANRAAQQLKTKRSRVVGLLTGDLENPFFARMVSLCSEALEKDGYEIVLASRRRDDTHDLHLLESLMSRQLAGVLVWSETLSEVREQVQRMEIANVVVMGIHIPGHDSVSGELETGVEAALDHLAEQGYERIGYFAPQRALDRPGDPRDRIYRERMAAWGRPVRIFAYDGTGFDVGAARVAAEALADQMACAPFSERPDALFCFNDMNAFGALMGLRRRGLRVPDDIALVGCDGLPLAAQLDVPLTSIAYPMEEVCRTAVTLLVERIRAHDGVNTPIDACNKFIPTQLVVRDSSVRSDTIRHPVFAFRPAETQLVH